MITTVMDISSDEHSLTRVGEGAGATNIKGKTRKGAGGGGGGSSEDQGGGYEY